MNKHAPGPWRWRPSLFKELDAQSSLHCAGDAYVLRPNSNEEITIEPADARLIAAAPEMLKLLRRIDASCACGDGGIQHARCPALRIPALLKKIRGG